MLFIKFFNTDKNYSGWYSLIQFFSLFIIYILGLFDHFPVHLIRKINCPQRPPNVWHTDLIFALHLAIGHTASPWAKCFESQALRAETRRRKRVGKSCSCSFLHSRRSGLTRANEQCGQASPALFSCQWVLMQIVERCSVAPVMHGRLSGKDTTHFL